jgi:hypothetical protein
MPEASETAARTDTPIPITTIELDAVARRTERLYEQGHLEAARQLASRGQRAAPITSGPAHARSCLARRGRLRRCACRAAAHRRTNARPRQCRRRLCLDLVLQADWPRAWQAFDVRFQFPDVVPTVTLTRKDGSTYAPQPWSQGPPPASLLVMGEQGLGDTIQFVRFLPQLAATGCKVPASSRGPCWVCSSRLSGRSTFSPCRRPGAE